jgi:hypothetical protein
MLQDVQTANSSLSEMNLKFEKDENGTLKLFDEEGQPLSNGKPLLERINNAAARTVQEFVEAKKSQREGKLPDLINPVQSNDDREL